MRVRRKTIMWHNPRTGRNEYMARIARVDSGLVDLAACYSNDGKHDPLMAKMVVDALVDELLLKLSQGYEVRVGKLGVLKLEPKSLMVSYENTKLLNEDSVFSVKLKLNKSPDLRAYLERVIKDTEVV